MIVKPDVSAPDRGCPVKPAKYRYHSLAKARAAARRQSNRTRTAIEPFRCDGGGVWHWHIGHDRIGRHS